MTYLLVHMTIQHDVDGIPFIEPCCINTVFGEDGLAEGRDSLLRDARENEALFVYQHTARGWELQSQDGAVAPTMEEVDARDTTTIYP